MKYNTLGGIDKPLSKLVFGTGNDKISGTDTNIAYNCLDLAYENGFTVFDSAHIYGNAEENLGNWLELRGLRDKIVIIDKGCNPGMIGSNDVLSPDTIRSQVTTSLERLHTDYIDIYILHRDDNTKGVGPIVEVLNELKSQGKINKFGGSNWTWNRVKEANDYALEHGLEGFSVASPCYNLAEYVNDPWGGSVSISGSSNKVARDWFLEQNMPIFNYSSLARGFLSGKFRTDSNKPIEECLWWGPIKEYYSSSNIEKLKRAEQLASEKNCSVSQICLAWLFAQPLLLFPIISPSSVEHMEDNINALDIHLSQNETKWLETT